MFSSSATNLRPPCNCSSILLSSVRYLVILNVPLFVLIILSCPSFLSCPYPFLSLSFLILYHIFLLSLLVLSLLLEATLFSSTPLLFLLILVLLFPFPLYSFLSLFFFLFFFSFMFLYSSCPSINLLLLVLQWPFHHHAPVQKAVTTHPDVFDCKMFLDHCAIVSLHSRKQIL